MTARPKRTEEIRADLELSKRTTAATKYTKWNDRSTKRVPADPQDFLEFRMERHLAYLLARVEKLEGLLRETAYHLDDSCNERHAAWAVADRIDAALGDES